MKLTAKKLKEILSYDPKTGVFRWLIRRPPIRVGAEAGHLNTIGYIVIGFDGALYLAHRLAWLYMTGKWPEEDMDHINGVRDDNRWANLREATRRENCRNSRIRDNNTSGLKGVSLHKKSGLWRARIRLNGGEKCRYFKTKEDAFEAYKEMSDEAYGNFSRHR